MNVLSWRIFAVQTPLMSSAECPTPERSLEPAVRLHRRALAAGMVASVTGLAGCVGEAAEPTPVPATEPSSPMASPTAVDDVPASPPVRLESTPEVDRRSGLLPDRHALVASPRLPLYGIGSDQVDPLLRGEIADWQTLGCGVSLPTELVTFGEASADYVATAESIVDFESLVGVLDKRPGAFSVVPLDLIDFRVNVLSIDGIDPLRHRETGRHGLITRIGVVGDIVPGRNVGIKMRNYNDYTYPFRDVAAELDSYDLTIANLEGNLSETIPPPTDPNTFDFVCDPAMIDGFRLAGIDAVSLANNHTTWNESGWGAQALLDTLTALDEAEMPRFGAGRTLEEARRIWTTEVNGLRVGFLSVDGVTGNLEFPYRDKEIGTVGADWAAGPDSPGTNPYLMEQLVADVASAAETHDIVIPYLHMGAEYQWTVPDWVVAAAHSAIDAGATMVVTNHPHIIQGMEIYSGRPIIYSVGNFIFDQMFSVDTRQGFILEITLDGPDIVGIRLRGVEIEDFCQPRLMTADEQAEIMDRFWRSTDMLASR
jgi:hypothetical protein